MKSLAIFFETYTGKYIKNLIIGLAAAIIMVGALFKLEHMKGAGVMLTVGLLTEAFIFLLLGILPPHKDYYWEKIHPGLDVNPEVEAYKKGGKHLKAHSAGANALAAGNSVDALDKMLQEANMNPTNIKKLSDNFEKFGQTVNEIKDISGVATATNQFSDSAREAAGALNEMKTTFSGANQTMASFNNAASDSVAFHQQVQVLSKNLGDLNKIYEVELNDANNHLKSMNKFYSNLVNASESMAASADDAQAAKVQIANLANNLTSLNQVYGNMLSAMQGRM